MKIILDYDSTLVDLMDPWLEWIKKTMNVSLKTSDVKYFGWLKDALGEEADEFWKTPGIYENVKPLPGSQDFVRSLLDRGHDVMVASASHHESRNEKAFHCLDLFGLQMMHTSRKFTICKEALLIDDCPAYVHAHVRENPKGTGFLFNYGGTYGWAKPLLSHRNIRTVTSYGQILTLLKEE